MKTVLSRAVCAITPTESELSAELRFAELLRSHIQANAPQRCSVVVTGSIAKRTFLRDKRDVDIFMLFDRSVPRDGLEPAVKELMRVAFPGLGYQLSYAEHPYVRFHFEGRRIDLVPAYKITDASQRLSAVDRSVLHTKFVMRCLQKKKRGDVLLLKQFLRADSLYGAEIKIEGFSGYLCELLIIAYGGFIGLLRAASRWDGQVFIDIRGHHEGRKAISGMIAKMDSGFIVIDPTDKDRNVAAAVSEKNLKRFISLAKAFLKRPSDSFFFRKNETFEEQVARASKGRTALLLSMPRPDIVDDILWGQLHKMRAQLESHLEDFEPKAIIADDSRHLVRLAMILGKDRLPKRMLLAGPPLSMKKHAEQFRKSHKGGRLVVKKGKIFADVRRRTSGAEGAVRAFFHYFSKTKSHLAYPEEMVLLERLDTKKKR
ncbi:MAG: CCA tRNA nucleotidyltransferase [Candidatus Micrarchaeota archaeon]